MIPIELWLAQVSAHARRGEEVCRVGPVHDEITHGCESKGMPTIMEQPYPMEFVRAGDDIRLRLEESDTVRTIHMSANLPRDPRPRSRLGRSTGRWDGSTLVVTTDGLFVALSRLHGHAAEPVRIARRAIHPEHRRYATRVFAGRHRPGDLH